MSSHTIQIPQAKQLEVLAKMKEIDLETYKEIFETLKPEEFAEFFYKAVELVGNLAGQTMKTHVANSATELFWIIQDWQMNKMTPERRAYVQDVMKKTEEEIGLGAQPAPDETVQ